MQIREQTADKLLLADNIWLRQILLYALIGAGIVLTLSTLRHYGWQSWYRFTAWFGVVMAVSGLVTYQRVIRAFRAEFDLKAGTFRLKQLRGWRERLLLERPLSEIADVLIEEPATPQGRQRLLLRRTNGETHPLSDRFGTSLPDLEAAVRAARGYLGK
jgi:hypothetical protein